MEGVVLEAVAPGRPDDAAEGGGRRAKAAHGAGARADVAADDAEAGGARAVGGETVPREVVVAGSEIKRYVSRRGSPVMFPPPSATAAD